MGNQVGASKVRSWPGAGVASPELLLINEPAVDEDLGLVIRENVMAAVFRKHSNSFLRIAHDEERTPELHQGTVHQLHANRLQGKPHDRFGALAYVDGGAAQVNSKLI